MKNRTMHIVMSAALILALVLGVVAENHHHDADGSMCLCMHACHHDCHDGHHHDCAHGGHADDSDCALHLDNARLDRHDPGADFPVTWTVIPASGICVPEPCVTELASTTFRPCRLSPGRHPSPRETRGPPAAV